MYSAEPICDPTNSKPDSNTTRKPFLGNFRIALRKDRCTYDAQACKIPFLNYRPYFNNFTLLLGRLVLLMQMGKKTNLPISTMCVVRSSVLNINIQQCWRFRCLYFFVAVLIILHVFMTWSHHDIAWVILSHIDSYDEIGCNYIVFYSVQLTGKNRIHIWLFSSVRLERNNFMHIGLFSSV